MAGALFHYQQLNRTQNVSKKKCNLSSGFIVCVVVRSIHVATYDMCLVENTFREGLIDHNAYVNPHGEADYIDLWNVWLYFWFQLRRVNRFVYICACYAHADPQVVWP